MFPYLVTLPGASPVEAWSTARLPFEAKSQEWVSPMKADLVAALRQLPAQRGHSLRAVFTSDDPSRVDTENVLFYNLGVASFRHLTCEGMAFERCYRPAPPPPRRLSNHQYRYHQWYATAPTTDEHSMWVVDQLLARWDSVALPPLNTGLTPSVIWAALVGAKAFASSARVPEHYGLRVQLRGTRGQPVSDFAKPLLDGIISALHRFKGQPDAVTVGRLAAACHLRRDQVAAGLCDQRRPVLEARRYVRASAAGVVWNPRDEDCVACVIVADPKGQPAVSGELTSLSPMDDSTRFVPLSTPDRVWTAQEVAALHSTRPTHNMEHNWWPVMQATKLRLYRTVSHLLVAELIFTPAPGGWRVASASGRPAWAMMLGPLELETILERELSLVAVGESAMGRRQTRPNPRPQFSGPVV